MTKRLTALFLLTACAPAHLFTTRTDREFGDVTPAITRWLTERHPEAHGPQHFCVIGYTETHTAYVHWREGRLLILWNGGDEDALLFSNRQLSLDTDVVPTEDDIQGSTYLVTKKWMDDHLADCGAHGEELIIQPAS